LAIITPQPVLHHKRFARVEGLRVNLETFLQIILVYAFGPAVTHFALQATAGKPQPGLVKKSEEAVPPRTPDKPPRRNRNDPKTRLAFAQLCLSGCALIDHSSEKQHRN